MSPPPRDEKPKANPRTTRGKSTKTLEHEHADLTAAFRQLQAEHDVVHQHPEDREAHQQHIRKLAAHVDAVRQHIRRLREGQKQR